MTEAAPGFAYSNVPDRGPGRVLRVVSRLLPGVGRVQEQVGPFAEAWQRSNAAAVATTGPLWVVLGDSLSQGIGAPAHDLGWVGQLRARRSYRVVNLSAYGARIQDVIDRQVPAMAQLEDPPDLVTLLIGSNDLFAQRNGLGARMTELLAMLPAGTVVATLPNPSRASRELNLAVERGVVAHGMVVAEMRGPRTTRWRGKLAEDHFHPNERGYAAIAEVFEDTLDRARAGEGSL